MPDDLDIYYRFKHVQWLSLHLQVRSFVYLPAYYTNMVSLQIIAYGRLGSHGSRSAHRQFLCTETYVDYLLYTIFKHPQSCIPIDVLHIKIIAKRINSHPRSPHHPPFKLAQINLPLNQTTA